MPSSPNHSNRKAASKNARSALNFRYNESCPTQFLEKSHYHTNRNPLQHQAYLVVGGNDGRRINRVYPRKRKQS